MLREKVVKLVNQGFQAQAGKVGSECEGIWGENKTFSENEQVWACRERMRVVVYTLVIFFSFYDSVLTALDLGSYQGGAQGRSWTIDPIDGTLGFLRKEQYAVCLALIVDGQVELGVLACPNLGTTSVEDPHKGALFLAVKGQGGWTRSLEDGAGYSKAILAPEPKPLRFLESVESGHSAHDVQARIGELLGVQDGTSIRMDSQAKYGALGRGEGGC